jgi:hypothetical protein
VIDYGLNWRLACAIELLLQASTNVTQLEGCNFVFRVTQCKHV